MGSVRPDASQCHKRLRRRGPRSLVARALRREAWFSRKASTPCLDDNDDNNDDTTNSTFSPSGSGAGQAASELPGFTNTSLTLYLVNIRGLLSKTGLLELHLAELGFPSLVALTETFLDKSVGTVPLTGYTLVGRKDRNSFGGGIALYVRDELAHNVTHLADSTFERQWFLLHTSHGPFVLAVWYRPPAYAEVASIETFHNELAQYRSQGLGTIVVGDLNCHHKDWLLYSHSVTPEGRALYNSCVTFGLEEKVKAPTRGDYLLDLVLTDVDCVSARVDAQVSDHCGVLASLSLSAPETFPVTRELWKWNKARWRELNDFFYNTNWHEVLAGPVEEAAETFTGYLLGAAKRFIPCTTTTVNRSSHPWLTTECERLVRLQRAAEGTPGYAAARDACSTALREAYEEHVRRTRRQLSNLPRSSKAWWKLCNALQLKANKCSSIPALKKTTEGETEWVRDSLGKAELFADTFWKKYSLPTAIENDFSEVAVAPLALQSGLPPIRTRTATKLLAELKADSGTGPDAVATRILKHCSTTLGLPVALLGRKVVEEEHWPSLWKVHWILPLYKKKTVFDPANYRGVHLTSQVAKVVERLVGVHLDKFFKDSGAFGPNQFAYRKAFGYKDALALNTLTWLWSLALGRKTGLYCSDVSGAFDRVEEERLLHKLECKGLRYNLLGVVASWLSDRTGAVVVEGTKSLERVLRNQVYQGTVLGPPLWNAFFEDAREAVNAEGFQETVFADDLNCYQDFPSSTDNDDVLNDLRLCQVSLHRWGAANRVTFDAGKESFHVLHRTQAQGNDFRILGCTYDCKLTMAAACRATAQEGRWRLKTVLRSRRYFTTTQLVTLYKSHVLSYLESSTGAFYHAAPTHLGLIDHVQEVLLRELGLTAEEALFNHRLAPLSTRRDCAMLGVIHRAVLGFGPPQFLDWFPLAPAVVRPATRLNARRHNKQVVDFCDWNHPTLLARSVLGLVREYNLLPQATVDAPTVKEFQSRLQRLVRNEAQRGSSSWSRCLARSGGHLALWRRLSA